MAKPRSPLTDEERDERRAAQRELVRASVEQLRSSEGWQAYPKARRQFPSYSWRNILLILHHGAAHGIGRLRWFQSWRWMADHLRRMELRSASRELKTR